MLDDAQTLLTRLEEQIRHFLEQRSITNPVIVGVRTGGVWIAERLRERLHVADALGVLDISFYRDDFSRIGIQPNVKPSRLPLDITDRHIILVDDVIHTGRTIRAALNEIFDYGRPASVSLAVLVDRNQRELPVQPNFVGQLIALNPQQHAQLMGPDPLRVEIITLNKK